MTQQSSDNALAGKRVLVIEDEALVTMLLEDSLLEIGCEIASQASRFQDAMAKANTLSFDVAILDVNLNDQQTYPIAAALVERGIPFVFATGYGAANLPDLSRQAPVLRKPFRLRDLERALRDAVGGFNLH